MLYVNPPYVSMCVSVEVSQNRKLCLSSLQHFFSFIFKGTKVYDFEEMK